MKHDTSQSLANMSAVEIIATQNTISSSGVYACGDNSEGNLSNGKNGKRVNVSSTPIPVEIRVPVRFVSVAAGLFHSLALTVDGKVWSWGRAENGRLGLGQYPPDAAPREPALIESFGSTQIAVVAAGYHHSMALSTKSQLYCWGSGWSGQLGTGITSDSYLPTRVDVPTVDDKSGKLTRLAAGYHHSLALTDTGRVYSWGYGEVGQLGHGVQKKRCPIPTMIENCKSTRFVSITASENHSVALSEEGNIYGWGYNKWNQLGHSAQNAADTTIPKPAETDGICFSRIAAGSAHTIAISKEGKLYYWGRMVLSSEKWEKPAPLDIPGNVLFSDVSSRVNHCLALSRSGEIWSLGYNEFGQCGQGHPNPVHSIGISIVLDPGRQPIRFASVVAGGNHSLALAAHESLQASGTSPKDGLLLNGSESSEDSLFKRTNSNGRSSTGSLVEERPKSPSHSKLAIGSMRRADSGTLNEPTAATSSTADLVNGNLSPRSASPRSRFGITTRSDSTIALELLANINRKEQDLRAERDALVLQQKALYEAMESWYKKEEDLGAEKAKVFKECGFNVNQN